MTKVQASPFGIWTWCPEGCGGSHTSHVLWEGRDVDLYECKACGAVSTRQDHWVRQAGKCRTCGNGFSSDHQDDHWGKCCDCYDESWGMAEASRSRPRKRGYKRPAKWKEIGA